ncbi:putative [FeFe] hydrogenase [Proteiniphilum saccharofermentans]|uniref:Putative [FeFe] hydrogenase n=1 Tax=Proteiniphilum saccharofermentans TaxID=1642647 RepID=A0A1R3TCU8_9BACT|nr:[Fe-Fe] hydrogenase large subunit C-terminal domain-containing protein [Proteiniphilum saccharofermentans]SCD21815.1 putative [FeFe] hydrogenase [Proteiniphilum saccharofermentans]
MKDRNYTHSIQIDPDRCTGCSHCMRVCSTQAIRIMGGYARIQPERCVDCGECFRVCPQRAIYAKDDGLGTLPPENYKIALVPSVFIGQFPSEYSATQVLSAVKQVGFDEVFEVEQAVDFMKEAYQAVAQQNPSHPLISSYCPAVVRLIQVQYPSLTGQIMRLKAPHDIAALYLRRSKEKEGLAPEKLSIYYVTPCAAKTVAARAPVGEEKSPINGTVNMTAVYNKASKILYGFKKPGLHKTFANMRPDSVNWSLSGTEKKYFPGRGLAIDGMDNVIEFLEKLESGHVSDIDFLEMRACDQGCAGGILCPGNRFLAVERLEHRQKRLQKLKDADNGRVRNPLMEYEKILHTMSGVDPVYPRDGLLLDEDIEKALIKLQRIERLRTYFPGFDCGACGAPGCRNLAEDIVQGKASISHCVFVQRVMEKNYKLSPDQAFVVIEKIWGKGRLDKYVDKV